MNIYDSFARVATYVELCSNIFFLSFNPPSSLKSFKINMFNMLGFQNLPKHPKLQSASIGSRCSSSKGFFFSQVFISGFWHSVQTCVRNSLYGFLWPHINSKISEPQNIDHTTQSGLHTFWLVLAMVFGEMNFVIWCCMLSHFLKKVFLQCRCYQGWFQYPSSWKPQAQLEKNWDPAFTFWSPVKNEHFRSMFVTCAFPGL